MQLTWRLAPVRVDCTPESLQERRKEALNISIYTQVGAHQCIVSTYGKVSHLRDNGHAT